MKEQFEMINFTFLVALILPVFDGFYKSYLGV
jgi:hypothetical protein